MDSAPQVASQLHRLRNLVRLMSWHVVRAWLLHLYTALGAVVAFFTLLCLYEAKFQEALWLMLLAVGIDATDGTIARAIRVKEVIPWFDGARLEDIIDYANYVIVPCLFMVRADVLPEQDAGWLAALPLIASAYGFCQKDAKTADFFFLGFPSYWNVVVFYFFFLKTPGWINAFCVIILAVGVFIPVKFVYPSRTPHYRLLTNGLGSLWLLLLMVIVYQLPERPFELALLSLFFPAYYLLLSCWLEFRRMIA